MTQANETETITEAAAQSAPNSRPGRKTVKEIIKTAGGAAAIAAATVENSGEPQAVEPVTVEAIYKWPKAGIPERHWWVVRKLCDVTAEELYQANLTARGG